jgi:hypothetical protein
MAIIKNISLDGDADRDILAWLESHRNQSAAVREAIRYYMAREDAGVTLADVLAEIRSLPSRLQVVAVASDEAPGGEEPAAAAANLDTLLDRLAGGAIE